MSPPYTKDPKTLKPQTESLDRVYLETLELMQSLVQPVDNSIKQLPKPQTLVTCYNTLVHVWITTDAIPVGSDCGIPQHQQAPSASF